MGACVGLETLGQLLDLAPMITRRKDAVGSGRTHPPYFSSEKVKRTVGWGPGLLLLVQEDQTPAAWEASISGFNRRACLINGFASLAVHFFLIA